MKRILFVLALLPILLASSCQDDDATPEPRALELPPLTHIGAGTFGCLMDGEVWLPEVDGIREVAIDALFTYPPRITITATKEPISTDQDESITISRAYPIDSANNRMTLFSNFYDKRGVADCKIIEVDTSQANYLIVDHLDETNSTISGRFECVMREPDCPEKTIRITEGRFDVRYRF